MSGECNICGVAGCVEANHLYALRNPRALEPHFTRHMTAMTDEALTRKDHIAAELAWRDAERDALLIENEELRTCEVCDQVVDHPATLVCVPCYNELDHYKRLATERGARMQTLRKWLCLEMVCGTSEKYDSLDEVWRDFTLMRPECVDWFDSDGVPR